MSPLPFKEPSWPRQRTASLPDCLDFRQAYGIPAVGCGLNAAAISDFVCERLGIEFASNGTVP
jgi:hypothetical protein